MKKAVCTLLEGDYYKGAIALINSLQLHDFKGRIYIGLKKRNDNIAFLGLLAHLPVVTSQEPIIFKYGKHIELVIVKIDTNTHFTNYKPVFLLDIFQKMDRDLQVLYYFDPDMVVNVNWSWFEMWIEQGIAVVHDVTYKDMPATHPIRKMWKNVIEEHHLGMLNHEINANINAGFLGVKRAHISLLEKWENIIDIATEKYSASKKVFAGIKRENPFKMLDQDALNVALMCTEHEISEMGCSAMGLDFNGIQVMLHAIGNPKPWRKHFVRTAFLGHGPSLADKGFVFYANKGSLQVYSSLAFFLKKNALRLSSLVHRFYRK